MEMVEPLRRSRRYLWPLGAVSCVVLVLAACGGSKKSGDEVSAEATGSPEVKAEIAGEMRQTGDAPGEVVVGEPVVLLEGGASAHTIVLQPGHSPAEEYAAEELRTHFEVCTGVSLPVAEEAPGETPMIVLGLGPVAEGLGVAPTELGEQGFVLRTIPPHIVIAGTHEAGTLYGVHRFLENHLGVRSYAPGETSTPAAAEIVVPPLDELVRPAFEWRHTSYRWPGKDDAFRARGGDNSGDGGADHPYGIQHSHDGRAHSYFWYVSPGEFFDEHPEYFSEIGGVRIREETQLCLTNPDVLDIVTERMLQRMADKPHARQHNFSQKDYYNYCQCDECTAMNEKYGTTGGTQFWFVNELAKRTQEAYPDKLIGTLAYMYTEEPPKELEMHPNVAVWLCHMFPSCDSHPIDSCPIDSEYKRRAEEWSQLAGHLYIWHYIVDFMHYYNPFPNFRAMAADMRFYRDIGVEGIYLQGMGHGGGGGEFSLLRPFYGMKLLWNPDLDPVALRRDFLEGYYGAAADPIESYIEMLHDEVTDKNIHMHLYTNPGQGYLSDEIMKAAGDYFDHAEELAGNDEELLERVKVARMPLTYAGLFPRNGYEFEEGTLVWQGEFAPMEEVLAFVDRMNAHGFETVREVGGQIEYLLLMYSAFSSDLTLRTIESDHLRVDVVAELGGRALRIIHKQSGECITANNVVPNLYFPYAGGLEDRIGGLYEAYGWVEPAGIAGHEENTLTVNMSTINGFQVSRKLTVDPEAPILHVKSTVTNPSDGNKKASFRSHLELDLGELHETRIAFTSLSGESVDMGVEGVIANLREGEHFYDQEAPAGSWTFTGTKGLEVRWSFDSAQVDHSWLYAYPDTLGELEAELWTPRLDLGPGESIELEHSIEVVVE